MRIGSRSGEDSIAMRLESDHERSQSFPAMNILGGLASELRNAVLLPALHKEARHLADNKLNSASNRAGELLPENLILRHTVA